MPAFLLPRNKEVICLSIFYPDKMFTSITKITPDILRDLGITSLMLDVDNTLTTHNNPNLAPEILVWLAEMRAAEIGLIIISNNSRMRVAPFAQILSLDFVSRAMKPLPFGYWHASKKLGTHAWQIAIVGDQIFTDILGGNICKMQTILLEPIEPERGLFFRIKRRIETVILRNYRRQLAKGDNSQ